MFGFFLPSLGWLAPLRSARAWEPTLLWNHYSHCLVPLPFRRCPSCPQSIPHVPMAPACPVTSVKNHDPALRPLDLSNTTSEPLSSCEPCLRLIGDWGA